MLVAAKYLFGFSLGILRPNVPEQFYRKEKKELGFMGKEGKGKVESEIACKYIYKSSKLYFEINV